MILEKLVMNLKALDVDVPISSPSETLLSLFTFTSIKLNQMVFFNYTYQ